MKIYPESEFLPRAPDPEEIILCDDEESEQKAGDLPIEQPEQTTEKTEDDLQGNQSD